MKGKMSATRSIGITKPLSSLQLKYIPPGQNMLNCRFCHTVHDPRLNPNAKEFIPGRLAGIENTAPSWNGAGWPFIPRTVVAFSCSAPPYELYNKHQGPAKRPAPCLPGGPVRGVDPPPAGVSGTCSARTDGGRSAAQAAASTSGVSRDGKPAKVALETAGRCTVTGPETKAKAAGGAAGPPDFLPSGPERRAADSPPQRGAEEVNKKHSTVAVLNGATGRTTTPTSSDCDSFIVSSTSAAETDLCRKISSTSVSPESDLTCSPTSSHSVHNASDTSKRTRSPSQCSDSTKPRRSNSRDSRANNPANCTESATTTAVTVIPCRPSSSTSDLDTPSECDAPASTSDRWRSFSSSSVSITTESSDDSSDESSDDDSTLGDDEWDASAATFLPGSSVESADDFILFASEDECCPTEPARSLTSATTIPQTPVFGPCPDQVDSGLSAETDPSESDEGNSSDDELSEDECELCQSEPAGTCTIHQRIAEANRQLDHWCGTPPHQPRTSKVRFLSGDRLVTVHAAPEYDRDIASDLLDQQRQRDRLQRWRQDVDRQVAPVLAAVLTPEHRQRVLSERPELLRIS